MLKKIGILTSGGDSQGMNAAIAGFIKTAHAKGLETYIIRDGYLGLINNWMEVVDNNFADSIMRLGGTVIGSARLPEFKDPKVREKAVTNLKKQGIAALVVIGGDGSYRGAQRLTEMGINCIALPGTIDNDITSSDYTIGFDTAINIVVEAIDRLRDTMQSHNRCSIVEVMGHACGDIALYAGIAGGADIISINEAALSETEIAERVATLHQAQKRSVIVVVSEMIYPDVHKLAKLVESKSAYITRATVLGHTQRGGNPTAMERYRAFQMAQFAVEQIIAGAGGLAIGNHGDQIIARPIMEALSIPRPSRKEIWAKFDELNQNIYQKS
ncbi:6-phosphofructokinase [Spiroplasma endosymbiont of Megaselia nigra]|uniref:6-phosphofructokinase n=1 Tax=Spiroplasma endosymbiont of Megaselia nigra TaxID=2478537 RepID=UPI000F8896B2|nr:6-phosphofructokinase [Spiroplasma endosymbiont of Megaselia nigra]RUO86561.1 6-phosphofructokinase [Spiroplasma endosymbiont of Megaselia nigra]